MPKINASSVPMRAVIVIAGLVFGAASAAAENPGAAWQEVVSKAKQEGRVNLYSVAVPQQTERLIAAFNKKHPEIRINHTRGAGEMPPRVEAERTAGVDGADVFIWSDPLWYNRNEEHLLPLDSPAGSAFPADRGWQVKGKAANVGFTPFGILVWNTDYVKGGLTDHRDLLKPEFKGRVATREDVTAVVAGYLDFLESELGPDYLRAFGQQKPRFYASLVPAVQAVASGEVWAANVGTPFAVKDLQEQGAPIAWAVPKPAGFANSWVGAVLKASKRPNAARVFLDFVLSPEGQQALNGEQASGSAIEGLQGTLNIAEFRVLQPERFTPSVREEWRKKFEDYFRKQ